MTTRTWLDSLGNWVDPALWTGSDSPQRGDTAVIAAGTSTLDGGGTLDAVAIDLGAPVGTITAELDLVETALGNGAQVLCTANAAEAILRIAGIVGFSGQFLAEAPQGSVLVSTEPIGRQPGLLVLRDGGQIDIGNDDALTLDGSLQNNGFITVQPSGLLVDSGTIEEAGAALNVQNGATLAGTGTIKIGLLSSVTLDQSSVTTVDIDFTDVGGRLILAAPGAYAGTIEGFTEGDLVNLTGIGTATEALVQSDTLTVLDGAQTLATLHVSGLPDGKLEVVPASTGFDAIGLGGIDIVEPGTKTRLEYLIATDARAVEAPAVNAEQLASGTFITGQGVKIGIISNSFDQASTFGGGDPANADARAGFLPATTDAFGDVLSAVNLLSDGAPGDDDEGRAMAELVHQIAPGAAIDFATGEGGPDGFAAAVTALADDGCNIIVDDLSYTEEPFFVSAGPIDSAIEQAVASGISYFTAAGNNGDQAYGGSFAPQQVTLSSGIAISAQTFSDGSPYQLLTLSSGATATIALQWSAAGTGDVTGSLQAYLYRWQGGLDAFGKPVPTGSPVAVSSTPGDAIVPETELSYDVPSTGAYLLAIAGDPTPGTPFKYILFGSAGGSSTTAGSIDDAEAGNVGAIFGHALLPEVNAVGAVDFPDTPAFNAQGPATSYYSSAGDADPSAKPDFVAPVRAATSVSGISPFDGTSAAAANAAGVAALVLQAAPKLTPTQLSSILKESSIDLEEPSTLQGAGLIQADAAVNLALDPACFAEGTHIETANGAVAVEHLRVGDRVRTAGGALRPIVWIGSQRLDLRRHPDGPRAWPVRIVAHAFAAGQPARDLRVSPDHAVVVDGALVPVRYLRNGATIRQEPAPRVTYWHIELPEHGIVFAEGLPVESYLDTGNRSGFAAGGAAPDSDGALRVWAERACLPLLRGGTALRAIRKHLLARAYKLGYRTVRDPQIRVQANGQDLQGDRTGYTLPSGTTRLLLRSRSWIPAEHAEHREDRRRLGIAVDGMCFDGTPLDLTERCLTEGWHAPEHSFRWTDGTGVLDVRGIRHFAFSVALTGEYWTPLANP